MELEKHEITEVSEVNDLVPIEGGFIVVKKPYPRVIGWNCSCGLSMTQRQTMEHHLLINLLVK